MELLISYCLANHLLPLPFLHHSICSHFSLCTAQSTHSIDTNLTTLQMDEFGVLVESTGFKAQGKSTPIADLKTKTNTNNGGSQNFGINSSFDLKPTPVNQSKSEILVEWSWDPMG
ncbi:uncharacterized protein LOC114263693 [Camellia sinensis]|uniref:uncharacterized protein LOC114263693 n=1 Tax=Camellia sinensis TaxID=4442 RepID=UPI0010369B2F|nr:uncharacterized protein LOC114263693 [Camellia sinensis]